MTEGEIAARYFGLARGMARARTAGPLRHLRDDVESAAMLGLAEAARCAARDGAEDPERYVRRTVKLRITDALRVVGPYRRNGEPRTFERTEAASAPVRDGRGQSARVPLASGAQRAISRGTGGGRMAHLMRWLVLALVLAAPAGAAQRLVYFPRGACTQPGAWLQPLVDTTFDLSHLWEKEPGVPYVIPGDACVWIDEAWLPYVLSRCCKLELGSPCTWNTGGRGVSPVPTGATCNGTYGQP